MGEKFKVDYDKKNDVMYIYDPQKKVTETEDQGNMLIDYDEKKEIVGIEIIGIKKIIKGEKE